MEVSVYGISDGNCIHCPMIKFLAPWIHATRPKTLPLAVSSTLLGSSLAEADGGFHWDVFSLAALTSVLLQILSNLANDYGDYAHGKDTADRIGPRRMVQSGEISPRTMRRAVALVGACTLMSGLILVLVGTEGSLPELKIFFVVLGIAAIAAAWNYTNGSHPYGYRGWGDLFVFLFFGLTGTAGTYILHTHRFPADILLPGASVGFLSTGVLNVNNLRDQATDAQTGKRTMVVLMGTQRAKIYHAVLLVLAVLSGCLYTLINYRSGIQYLFLLSLPFLYRHGLAVIHNTRSEDLNLELRNLSLTTFFFSVTFGIGVLLR